MFASIVIYIKHRHRKLSPVFNNDKVKVTRDRNLTVREKELEDPEEQELKEAEPSKDSSSSDFDIDEELQKSTILLK